MQTANTESLMDEAGFLAELDGLEDGMTGTQRAAAVIAELPVPARTTPQGKFDDEEHIAPVVSVERDGGDRLSIGQQVMAATMFVLMMGVGAAGAAAVFHERVARILATW